MPRRSTRPQESPPGAIPTMFTLAQVAELCNVSIRTVKEWVRLEMIDYWQPMGPRTTIRIPDTAVRDLIEHGRRPALHNQPPARRRKAG